MPETTGSRGERTRMDITQAAHQLFIQQGYHGTSMRQIATQAGIALGSLYNHFSSKEEVFKAVFDEYHPYHEVLPAMQSAQGETIEEVVRDAARLLVKALDQRPHFLNLMFIEIVEFDSQHITDLFLHIFPNALQIAQRFTKLGGERLQPIPPPMLLRSFLGFFFSYYITEKLLSPLSVGEFTDQGINYFVDIYLHGIVNNSP